MCIVTQVWIIRETLCKLQAILGPDENRLLQDFEHCVIKTDLPLLNSLSEYGKCRTAAIARTGYMVQLPRSAFRIMASN